jgi:hypothetical protein
MLSTKLTSIGTEYNENLFLVNTPFILHGELVGAGSFWPSLDSLFPAFSSHFLQDYPEVLNVIISSFPL